MSGEEVEVTGLEAILLMAHDFTGLTFTVEEIEEDRLEWYHITKTIDEEIETDTYRCVFDIAVPLFIDEQMRNKTVCGCPPGPTSRGDAGHRCEPAGQQWWDKARTASVVRLLLEVANRVV